MEPMLDHICNTQVPSQALQLLLLSRRFSAPSVTRPMPVSVMVISTSAHLKSCRSAERYARLRRGRTRVCPRTLTWHQPGQR